MNRIRYQIVTEDRLRVIHDALLRRSNESLYPSAIPAYAEAWALIYESLGIEEISDESVVWLPRAG
jgi:hypothetical protein